MASLNAFALAMYPPGEDQKAIDTLNEFWTGLKDSMLFKSWSLGYVQGLFFKSGLYDTSPFPATLSNFAKKFTGKLQRHISIGTTDINSGGFL